MSGNQLLYKITPTFEETWRRGENPNPGSCITPTASSDGMQGKEQGPRPPWVTNHSTLYRCCCCAKPDRRCGRITSIGA